MNFRVCWRDGSTTEDIANEEAMALIAKRPSDWAAVQPMNYARDVDPKHAKSKQAAWGKKK